MSDSSTGPSVSLLAGQLEYLFEDHPSLRDAPVAQLVARLNEKDRWARAISRTRTQRRRGARPPRRVPRPHRRGGGRAGPPAGARPDDDD